MTVKLVPEAITFFRHQNYGSSIHEVKYARLTKYSDDGGSLTELSRFAAGVPKAFSEFNLAQLNYSTIEPGVIKAFHLHATQRDIWFVPPEDRVLLVLVDVRADSPTPRQVMKVMLGDGNSILISIPPGVAHGCKNLGDRPARIIYMTDVEFSPDPAATDEGRLPWDLIGPEIWEPAKD